MERGGRRVEGGREGAGGKEREGRREGGERGRLYWKW